MNTILKVARYTHALAFNSCQADFMVEFWVVS
jgi:hypothetical protein